MLFAESLNGPWRRMNMTGFGRSEWPWTDVNLGLESHGAQPCFCEQCQQSI